MVLTSTVKPPLDLAVDNIGIIFLRQSLLRGLSMISGRGLALTDSLVLSTPSSTASSCNVKLITPLDRSSSPLIVQELLTRDDTFRLQAAWTVTQSESDVAR